MRYAVLSDVHANLHALRAVLDAVAREGVDGYLCTGDLVGYGAHPDACIELLASLDARCVAGNHDLLATGQLSPERSGQLARSTLAWTVRALSASSQEFLRALPARRRVGPALLAHGSPEDPEEYVRSDARAAQLLDELDREPGSRLLLLGHTHQSWACGRRSGTQLRGTAGTVALDDGQRYLLNPGSVGQARERAVVARYAVLDLDAGSAAFRAVDYDVDACRRDLVRAGLPPTTYQLRTTLPEHARSAAGRVRRRLRRSGASG